jgi:hypothetical protein
MIEDRPPARTPIEGRPPPLPDRPPDRVFAGRGSGRRCRLCGSAIESGDIEWELVYEGADAGHAETHAVHSSCFMTASRSQGERGGDGSLPRAERESNMPRRENGRAGTSGSG